MHNQFKKLLIVDDEELLLKSLKREVEVWAEDNSVEVETFTSGYTALDYLKEHHNSVFLIISDVRMPAISGPAFLMEVKKLYPEIKLFLLTAYSDIPDIQSAIKASISRLILKPWDSDKLITEIMNIYNEYHLEFENRRLKQELDQNIAVAGEFQHTLLNDIVIQNLPKGTDIFYQPVKTFNCGGDYYDFIDIDKNRRIILIGDVSGHGIKPAFVTAMLKVLISMYRSQIVPGANISPGEIIEYLNDGLYKSLGKVSDIIVTMTCLLIDSDKNQLVFSGAGQLPIYILRNENLLILDNDNVAMGFMPDIHYSDKKQDLQYNNLIIIYTDGLIESEKRQIILEKSRIRSILLTMDLNESPAEKIVTAFKTLLGDGEFCDDVTLITSRFL